MGVRIRTGIALGLCGLIILCTSQGSPSVSHLDSVISQYKWGLIGWETKNVLDKWEYRLLELMPWHQPSANHNDVLQELFLNSAEIEELEVEIAVKVTIDDVTDLSDTELKNQLANLKTRQAQIRPQAEELLEGLISSILKSEGFQSRIGLIWPPVDVSLTTPPTALIISPRDVIERQTTVTLRPNLTPLEIEALEHEIQLNHNLSALVVEIGGIATYPSIVPIRSGLPGILELMAHEWLHQFWFFRPLGQNYWRDENTMILNETAAAMAGRELGEQAYNQIPAQMIPDPLISKSRPYGNHGLDFSSTMRETRFEVDNLLKKGEISMAEHLMEQRRILFFQHGYFIRKLNQAYFAFYGTYAHNPASTSPIQEELQQFRGAMDGTGDFIRELSSFSSYDDFKTALKYID